MQLTIYHPGTSRGGWCTLLFASVLQRPPPPPQSLRRDSRGLPCGQPPRWRGPAGDEAHPRRQARIRRERGWTQDLPACNRLFMWSGPRCWTGRLAGGSAWASRPGAQHPWPRATTGPRQCRSTTGWYRPGEVSSGRRTPSAVAVHRVVSAGQTGPYDKARLRRPQSITEEVRYEELDDAEHHAGHCPSGRRWPRLPSGPRPGGQSHGGLPAPNPRRLR